MYTRTRTLKHNKTSQLSLLINATATIYENKLIKSLRDDYQVNIQIHIGIRWVRSFCNTYAAVETPYF
jgi:hypothetical protein